MHFSAGCRRGEGQVSGLTLGFLGRVYFPFSLQIVFCTSTFRNLNRKLLVRRHLLCDRAVTIDEGGQACCQDAGQAAMGEPYTGFLFEPTLRGKGICKVMKLAPQP